MNCVLLMSVSISMFSICLFLSFFLRLNTESFWGKTCDFFSVEDDIIEYWRFPFLVSFFGCPKVVISAQIWQLLRHFSPHPVYNIHMWSMVHICMWTLNLLFIIMNHHQEHHQSSMTDDVHRRNTALCNAILYFVLYVCWKSRLAHKVHKNTRRHSPYTLAQTGNTELHQPPLSNIAALPVLVTVRYQDRRE